MAERDRRARRHATALPMANNLMTTVTALFQNIDFVKTALLLGVIGLVAILVCEIWGANRRK